MFPFFTAFAVLFIIVFTIGSRKNTAEQQKVQEAYWQREREANNVRKQDLSKLNYINIPLHDFPMDLHADCEITLRELSEKKIVNLTGYSNTDLKLEYGVANLETLSEYDSNFATLVTALADYSRLLLEANRTDDAKKVLEYAVSVQADSIYIYTTLAQIYHNSGEDDKIADLITSAEDLKSISKITILENLNSYTA